MKTLLIMGGLLLSISLMSFAVQTSELKSVSRLGENYFSVESSEGFTDQENSVIQGFIRDAYDLTEWGASTEDIELQMKAAAGKEKKCANSILDKKVFMKAVKQKLTRYDCAPSSGLSTEAEVIGILDRYAR